MKVKSEFVFTLDNEDDDLSVCEFEDSVGLSSLVETSTEFRIDFFPRHIPKLRLLVAELEQLEERLKT